MKFSELQKKDEQELRQILQDLTAEFSLLQIQRSSNTLKDPSKIKKSRKDIARILTMITQIHYNKQSA